MPDRDSAIARPTPTATGQSPSRILLNCSAVEASPTTGYSHHGSRVAASAIAGQNRTRLTEAFQSLLGRCAVMQFRKWVINSAVATEDRVASTASAPLPKGVFNASLVK